MNRIALFLLATITGATLTLGAGWQTSQGPGNSREESRERHVPRPRVIIKMQHVAVPQPNRIAHPEHIVHDNRHINWPRRDEQGVRIVQPATRIPPAHHVQVTGNHVLVRNIVSREPTEIIVNHYYWHADRGARYCHYYDGFGVHWYGFYHGPTFYWTRYYANRWWWYDPHFLRWVYWWNGYWWWPSPAGAVYVYVQDNYYPYEPSGVVTVAHPEVQTPPAVVPAAPNSGTVSNSPDRSRSAQIDPAGNAYLYDQSSGQPVYIKFLGEGVSQVKFSGGKDGKPMRILVLFKDGSFALFDQDGNPLDAPSVSSEEAPGPPPASMPPAPN